MANLNIIFSIGVIYESRALLLTKAMLQITIVVNANMCPRSFFLSIAIMVFFFVEIISKDISNAFAKAKAFDFK